MCYHVQDVPDRDDIEIHSANYAGDVAKGLRCQLLGCIAPGLAIGQLAGQRAVLQSKEALMALETALNHESFMLTIEQEH